MRTRGRNERAAVVVEYALIVAGIALLIVWVVGLREALGVLYEQQACNEAAGFYCD